MPLRSREKEEEIQALQDYIVENADYIHGDFNMEKFLSDLSTAFLRVAFKYNEYETNGLELKYWRGAGGDPSIANNRVILPPLLMRWGSVAPNSRIRRVLAFCIKTRL